MQRTVSPKRKERRPRSADSKSVMVRESQMDSLVVASDDSSAGGLTFASRDSASRAHSRVVAWDSLPRGSARLLRDIPLPASSMARSSSPLVRRKEDGGETGTG